MNITQELANNLSTFKRLLTPIDDEHIDFRQAPEKWNLRDIACHMYDEERLDFRFRIQWLFEKPEQTPPPFNPLDWVVDHDYTNQDFTAAKAKFFNGRKASIKWLNELNNAPWQNGYDHQKAGRLTAQFFLENWLAHDYLHIRQLLRLHFDYLDAKTSNNLEYAGGW